MRTYQCLLAAILVIAPFGASAQPIRLGQEQRQACLAKGGRLSGMTLRGDEGCILPMADAGKVCSSGSQCQASVCRLNEAITRPHDYKVGKKAAGICAAENGNFNGTRTVTNGRLDPTSPTE